MVPEHSSPVFVLEVLKGQGLDVIQLLLRHGMQGQLLENLYQHQAIEEVHSQLGEEKNRMNFAHCVLNVCAYRIV